MYCMVQNLIEHILWYRFCLIGFHRLFSIPKLICCFCLRKMKCRYIPTLYLTDTDDFFYYMARHKSCLLCHLLIVFHPQVEVSHCLWLHFTEFVVGVLLNSFLHIYICYIFKSNVFLRFLC